MTDTSILDPQLALSDDVREELARAANAAESWEIATRPTTRGTFHERVIAAKRAVQQLEQQLSSLPASPANADPNLIALLDLRATPRLLRSGVSAVSNRPKDLEELPRVVLPGQKDEPRIATVAAAYLRAVKGDFSAPTFTAFVRTLQANDPFTVKELWAVPAFLRFCLVEIILDDAFRALQNPSAAANSLLAAQFTSLRGIANTDWLSIVEPLIVLDGVLVQDPAGTYQYMDFETREVYRKRIAFIARHSDCTENEVAQAVLELARESAKHVSEDPRIQRRRSHVGYYLIDKGYSQLAAQVNFHPRIYDRIRAAIRANADDFYITGIELITIFFIAAALFPLLPNFPVFGRLAIAFVLMILPAMQCAVELVNNSVTAIFDPEPLPKMDFSKGIPDECATLVAVPTLLLKEKQVRELVTELEVRFLANRDRNLHFALLTDLPDSVSKSQANDSNPLVDLAANLIDELNAKYASTRGGAFLLLHRHRMFNVRQGVWMGWERKRGKLLDLNKFLMGEYDAFPIKAGNLESLKQVKYILTLDSDTQLPRGNAARMVGAITHPLNQAVIDPKLRIVVAGYGILQPRIGVSVSSASRSRLAAIYSGQNGFDIYTRAISDAYQDLYGEGIFTGKGIYEVAALHAVLNHRFPRNSLLSHDLIEGAYARVGLVTDIELIDDYPSHYSAYTRRKHRWVRGDWQIAQWMFSHVPDESNRRVQSPISTIARWKIFDNLRRSLVEPFTLILFVAGWLGLAGGPIYWTVVSLILFFFPTIVGLAFGVGRAILGENKGNIGQAFVGPGQAALVTLLNLIFLPHQTMLAIDAIFRALVRRFITGERLLEWETAAESESRTTKTPVDRYLTLMPVFSFVLAIVVYAFAPQHNAIFVAAPLLILWCLATPITAWLNKQPREEQKRLSSSDKTFLQCHALRIWRYFYEFGGERHNYLIPDNVEEKGLFEAARVSPTNVGLLLNARQAACEFGFLTVPEFAMLTDRSLDTIGRLKKHRGHLYNWYDTHTCEPLEVNPFVSTVDSGNFVASLYTLHAGALDLLKKPLLSRALFTGLRVHWQMLQSFGKLPSPLQHIAPPGHSATIAEWIEWLPKAANAFSSLQASASAEPWWFAETHHRIESIQTLIRGYLPWLSEENNTLHKIAELGIDPKSELLSIEDAAVFAESLERKLAEFVQGTDHGGSLAQMRALQEALPVAVANLRALAEDVASIAQRAERMAEETEFGFLVSPSRLILSIGYDVRGGKIHDACYDMLASEARIATFLAIAREDLPQQSWFKLARDYTNVFGTYAILSWTGTMFEYLMPSLWMRSYPHTLISQTVCACIEVQKAFARSLGIPWGISESGDARKDDAGHYHYHAYGVPQLAIFYEAKAGPVVSPYSTFLAVGLDSIEALRNLRHMSAAGWVGAYGFYESIDYSTSSRNGEVVREWMAHHQGMSLLAILNCLCEGVVQQWFHAHPLMQSTELLLHEAPTNKAVLKAMMKDFAAIPPRVGHAA
jgi:hypothetical protein